MDYFTAEKLNLFEKKRIGLDIRHQYDVYICIRCATISSGIYFAELSYRNTASSVYSHDPRTIKKNKNNNDKVILVRTARAQSL